MFLSVNLSVDPIDEESRDSAVEQMMYSQEDVDLFQSESSDEELLASFSQKYDQCEPCLDNESDLDDEDLLLATLQMEVEFDREFSTSTPMPQRVMPTQTDEAKMSTDNSETGKENVQIECVDDTKIQSNNSVNFLDGNVESKTDLPKLDVNASKSGIDGVNIKSDVAVKDFIYPLNSSSEKPHKSVKLEPMDFSIYTCEFSSALFAEDSVCGNNNIPHSAMEETMSRKRPHPTVEKPEIVIPDLGKKTAEIRKFSSKESVLCSQKNNLKKFKFLPPVIPNVRTKTRVFPLKSVKKVKRNDTSIEITNAVMKAKAQLLERNRLLALRLKRAAADKAQKSISSEVAAKVKSIHRETSAIARNMGVSKSKSLKHAIELHTEAKKRSDRLLPEKFKMQTQIVKASEMKVKNEKLSGNKDVPKQISETEQKGTSVLKLIGDLSVGEKKDDKLKKTSEKKEHCSLTKESISAKILKWNVSWLEEQEKIKERPPPLFDSKGTLVPVLDSYVSWDEYAMIYLPLLMHELWEEMFKEWKALKQSKAPKKYFALKKCQPEPPFSFLSCQIVGLKSELLGTSAFKVNDIVILELRVMDSEDICSAFGIVKKIRKSENIYELHPLLRILLIREDAMIKVIYKLLAITSIANHERRFDALVDFKEVNFLSHFLTPHPLLQMFAINKPVEKLVEGIYNDAQVSAIREASALIMEPVNSPKIYLLQGPPGTGKSRTVVGIIVNMLTLMKKQNRDIKILVCAPSNGGCDEVARRLLATVGDKGILRVGRGESVDRKITKIFIENVVQERLREQSTAVEITSESLRNNIKEKENMVYNFELQLKDLHAKETERRNELLEKISMLKMSLNRLHKFVGKTGLNNTAERLSQVQLRERILKESNVIICTLNFSGSHTLDPLLPTVSRSSWFDCLVIDEAAQSVETECLIPLRFGVTKMILVGDPEQLPATVLSKVAYEFGLGQSLFQRFYQRFFYEDYTPVRMLTEQYRMHPNLCEFPSKYIYKSKLYTNSAVAEQRKKFPFVPYLVFNIERGNEQSNDTGSMFNVKEAEFVVKACTILTAQGNIQPKDIGVITFYQQQVLLIREKLQMERLKELEVNTVDSYQGREKDVIILSCVRANQCATSIGFVANRQRMNVAITRARYALYVFGHLDSLQIDENWSALISDAMDRRLIVNVHSAEDLKNLHVLTR